MSVKDHKTAIEIELKWRSPTYAAHDAHDPPAGVIADTFRHHGRSGKLYGSQTGTSRW